MIVMATAVLRPSFSAAALVVIGRGRQWLAACALVPDQPLLALAVGG